MTSSPLPAAAASTPSASTAADTAPTPTKSAKRPAADAPASTPTTAPATAPAPVHDATPAPSCITVTLNPAIDRTLTVPDFGLDRVNRASACRDRAGGKGINVAIALADLGERVAVTGFLGRANTEIFTDAFDARGIADGCRRLPGETRVGIKIMDPRNQSTTDINLPGLAPTEHDLEALLAELLALVTPGARVVLSGSLPPGVPASYYADLIPLLRARGAEILVDTSGAPLRAILAGHALPNVLKPNLHELEEALDRPLPDPTAAAAAARELCRRGADLVAVSLGSAGACFVTRDAALLATPPAGVKVLSTVGAGDALLAGIAYARGQGLSLAETARLATGVALDRLGHLDAGLSSPAAPFALAKQVQVVDLPLPTAPA